VIRGGPRRRPDESDKRFDADISKTGIFVVQSGLLKISAACGEPGPRINCPLRNIPRNGGGRPHGHAAHTAAARAREY